MKTVCQNKRAGYEYELLEKFDAGIVLTGDEIKSVREGHMSIMEAFVQIRNGTAVLKNAYIKPYVNSFINAHTPIDERCDRVLLLHKKEIAALSKGLEQKGLTVVPIKAFFSKSYLKVSVALARGKKLYDKKDSIKQKDISRNTDRVLADL